MHAVIGAADAAGEPLIALLGDQRLYGRFGFVQASRMGILAPDPRVRRAPSGADAHGLPVVERRHVSLRGAV
jgi:predicted N-acetyltransferase YhbS